MLKSNTNRKILPAVKPPHRKTQVIKKTRDTKENNLDDEEIEEFKMRENSQQVFMEKYLEKERITPLLSSRDDDLSDFSKTKKCRVSKML